MRSRRFPPYDHHISREECRCERVMRPVVPTNRMPSSSPAGSVFPTIRVPVRCWRAFPSPSCSHTNVSTESTIRKARCWCPNSGRCQIGHTASANQDSVPRMFPLLPDEPDPRAAASFAVPCASGRGWRIRPARRPRPPADAARARPARRAIGRRRSTTRASTTALVSLCPTRRHRALPPRANIDFACQVNVGGALTASAPTTFWPAAASAPAFA